MTKQFSYLKFSKTADASLLKILKENIVGTPGKSMMYQFFDMEEKISLLPDPTFVNLHIRDRLVGTICFSKRNIMSNDESGPAYYLRYFTFLEHFRSSDGKPRRAKRSRLRQEVNWIMNGEGLEHGDRSMLYAFVDDDNIRSRRLIDEFGFQNVGSFHTIPFSRLFPKIDRSVEILNSEGDLDAFKKLIDSYFAKYQFYFSENFNKKGKVMVVKDRGEIVCGMQAIPDQWKVLHLPGLSGKIALHIVPWVPIINRLFHTDYKFVMFESVFCKPGYEKKLIRLFESALAYYKLNSGILCVDPRSAIYQRIIKKQLGLIHKLMGEKSVNIVAKANGDVKIDTTLPVYISGFDVL